MTDSISQDMKLAASIEAIDAANSQDPNTLVYKGEEWPKELCHGHLATEWLLRLEPEAAPIQQLAARAHHIKRWEIPRDSYTKDRRGYLKWRTELARFHATEAGAILEEVGYDSETVKQVQSIIQKRNLKTDSRVQTHEDVLCLVFFSTQLDMVSQELELDKLIDVLAKTLNKMSQRGREQAARLSFNNRERRIFSRALTVSKSL